jgi:predicted DNA-binding protein (UPF0251 family)
LAYAKNYVMRVARPIKCRIIEQQPISSLFKPLNVFKENEEFVSVSLDEFETIKLIDFMGMYQDEAADRMEVSRQTLGNMLRSARTKIADALINAKTLKIDGGSWRLSESRRFACDECNHHWIGPVSKERPARCPHCGCDCIHQHDTCHRRVSCNNKGKRI